MSIGDAASWGAAVWAGRAGEAGGGREELYINDRCVGAPL